MCNSNRIINLCGIYAEDLSRLQEYPLALSDLTKRLQNFVEVHVKLYGSIYSK